MTIDAFLHFILCCCGAALAIGGTLLGVTIIIYWLDTLIHYIREDFDEEEDKYDE